MSVIVHLPYPEEMRLEAVRHVVYEWLLDNVLDFVPGAFGHHFRGDGFEYKDYIVAYKSLKAAGYDVVIVFDEYRIDEQEFSDDNIPVRKIDFLKVRLPIPRSNLSK